MLKIILIVFILVICYKQNNFKWINYPHRSAPKDKVLDQYLSVIQKHNLMEWDNASTPMLDPDLFDQDNLDELANEMLYIHDPDTTEAERIQDILDAKYCKADLEKLSQECNRLNWEDQQQLL